MTTHSQGDLAGRAKVELVVTLSHVSSIGSEFGALGERVAAMTRALPDHRPVDPARHVWVETS